MTVMIGVIYLLPPPTDRQTVRQTDRQTVRQTDRQTIDNELTVMTGVPYPASSATAD